MCVNLVVVILENHNFEYLKDVKRDVYKRQEYTPHVDTGDYVIVVNAEKIHVTGKKLDQKIYYHHSDYVGGMKDATLREKLNKKPCLLYTSTPEDMMKVRNLGRKSLEEVQAKISELGFHFRPSEE